MALAFRMIRQGVEHLVALTGARTVYDTDPLQALWRDLTTIGTHYHRQRARGHGALWPLPAAARLRGIRFRRDRKSALKEIDDLTEWYATCAFLLRGQRRSGDCSRRARAKVKKTHHQERCGSGACGYTDGVPLGRAIRRDLLELKRLYVDPNETCAATQNVPFSGISEMKPIFRPGKIRRVLWR